MPEFNEDDLVVGHPLPKIKPGEAEILFREITSSLANPFHNVREYLWSIGFRGEEAINELFDWYMEADNHSVSRAAKIAYEYDKYLATQKNPSRYDTKKELFMWTLEALAKAGRKATLRAVYESRINPYDFLESLKR